MVASGPAPAPRSRSTPELGMHETTAAAMSPSGISMMRTPSFLRVFSISMCLSRSSIITVRFSRGRFFSWATVRTIFSMGMSTEILPMELQSVAIFR